MGDGIVGAAIEAYRLNGPFDPEVRIGGGAPIGFQGYQGQYAKYIVHNSLFKAQFRVRDNSAVNFRATNVAVGICWNSMDGTTPPLTSFDTINELRRRSLQRFQGERFKWRQVVRNPTTAALNAGNGRGGGMNIKPFKLFTRNSAFPMDAPYGRVHIGGEDPYGMTSDIAGTPLEERYVNIFAISLEDSGVFAWPLPYIYVDITVWYDVEFYAPYYDL